MDYLKAVSPQEAVETMGLIKDNQVQKTIYRNHRQGYTNDRGKLRRHIASIPFWVTLDPRFADYFHKDAPAEERKKDIYRFLRDHPEFLLVDKL